MTEYVNHPLIRKNRLEARIYQQVLFSIATEHNTLVILPTGLGKTILFVMLAAHKLQLEPDKKIIITAPTKPLVEQHAETLKYFLNIPEEKIVVLDGSVISDKRSILYKNASIISATPQVLRNDIIDGKLELENVSLICFDEAHRAVGNYPYVLLAKEYTKRNESGRILAITASPGSKENMKEVVENLRINKIEHRDENSLDVKPYIQRIEEEIIRVDLPEGFKQVRDLLMKLFKEQLSILKSLGLVSSVQIEKNSRTELLSLQKKLVGFADSGEIDTKDYFIALGALGNSIRISHALELLETQGIPSLDEYLKKMERDTRNRRAKSLVALLNSYEMRKVYEIVEELRLSGSTHPKFPVLKEVLLEQINSHPNSKILVFAHYRSTAKFLVEELNKISGINAMWFVGQSNKGKNKGLSQKEQIKILNDFRSGLYNVLVATSVAEEGLDITQVDLVVFYDIVPSATRTVQRKGRTGRKREGKVVLLIAKGTRDEGYLWAARRKEKEMKNIAKVLSNAKNEKEQDNMNIDKFLTSETSWEYKKSHEKKVLKSEIKNVSLLDFLEEKITQSEEDIDETIEETIVEILVDPQEKNSTLLNVLLDLGAKLRLMKAPLAGGVADYVVGENVGIQRKSTKDFVMTLQKKGEENLFVVLKKLKKLFPKPLLIIEGEDLYYKGVHASSIRGAINTIILDLGVPIIWSKNTTDTAKYLYLLAKKEQEVKPINIQLSTISKNATKDDVLIAMLTQVPGIETKLARKILKKFPSLDQLVRAKQEEFMEIKGIGKILSYSLYEHLHHVFGEKEKQ